MMEPSTFLTIMAGDLAVMLFCGWLNDHARRRDPGKKEVKVGSLKALD